MHHYWGRNPLCAALVGASFAVVSFAAAEAPGAKTAVDVQAAPSLEVATFGRSAPAVERSAKTMLLPPSVEYALPQLRANFAVSLPPIDHEALLTEDLKNMDGADFERRPLRIGIARDVVVTDANGVWQSIPGIGYVWTAAVESAGAFQTRLHFADVNLPDGARLWVYSTSDDYGNWNHFENAGPFSDGEFWTSETTGQTVQIEYVVPFDAVPEGELPRAEFIVDSLQHQYRELRPILEDGLRDVSCMADSACYSPWDTVRNCAARISFVDGGSYLCSGQLVDTVAGDFTPYFNTANHCVSTSTVAHTVTAYFFNQRSTCGGAFDTQRSATYAELVSTLYNADATLLLIEGVVPYGFTPSLYWTGWTSSTPANGTDIVSIHHPEGSWKRISFGDKDSNVTVSPSYRCYLTYWTTPPGGGSVSVTAGGSSGGGLWIESTQQLIGQLLGGWSYCTDAGQPDVYGRFDWAYNNATGWAAALQGGSDDNLENNDDCASAVEIGSGTYADRVVKLQDEDWYKFFLTPCQTVDVDLTFTDSWGDVDMRIYNGCGGSVVASSLTNTNNETLLYTPITAGWYYLRVNLDDDTRNEYDMQVSIYDNGASPPAGSCDFDCDGQVRWNDYDDFAGCITGPGAGPLTGDCDIADTDGDDDVDTADYQVFQQLRGN